MFRRKFAAIAAMLPFVLATGNAPAALPAPCWQAGELPAVRLHEFKTMLLVGALRCSDRAPGALESYNQFVNQQRELIVLSVQVVRARFIRDGGMTAGADAFTNYETRLGNHYSSMTHDAAFCAKVGTYARLAASASGEDIGVLWGAVAPAQSTDSCGPGARESIALAAAQPVVAPDPLPVEAAPAGLADAAAAAPVVASASPAAATRADVPPAAVPAVALGQPKAETPAAPSAAQSLAEAAKALAAAAAALEAQNPHLATASKPN